MYKHLLSFVIRGKPLTGKISKKTDPAPVATLWSLTERVAFWMDEPFALSVTIALSLALVNACLGSIILYTYGIQVLTLRLLVLQVTFLMMVPMLYIKIRIVPGGKIPEPVLAAAEGTMGGKVAVVTGANCGLGLATTMQLAKLGCSVVMACRSTARAQNARAELISRFNVSDSLLEVEELDLASFESIRQFAARWSKRKSTNIHYLVNNAGVMRFSSGRTTEGFEIHFGTNYLGHFLLTRLLLPYVEATEGRIINVSSHMIAIAPVVTPTIIDTLTDTRNEPMICYAVSKTCNVLFTKELNHRFRKRPGGRPIALSCAPGAVLTEMTRKNSPVSGLTSLIKTAEQGAQTQLYLCLAPRSALDPDKFYGDCKKIRLTTSTDDGNSAKQLWKYSERLIQERSPSQT